MSINRLYCSLQPYMPRWIDRQLTGVWLFLNYHYDYHRFRKFSKAVAFDRKETNRQAQLRALITMDYHRIEKGLSLRSPRPGFGTDAVSNLLTNIDNYINHFNADHTVFVAINTLLEYKRFNDESGGNIGSLSQRIIDLEAKANDHQMDCVEGGVKWVNRETLYDQAKGDLHGLLTTRHSVRHYSEHRVSDDLIDRAVQLAMRSPSVCNRQCWRVYDFAKGDKMKSVLECQNGNRGFRSEIGRTLIVAADVRTFVSVGERNQPWIDGGMFAMSLIYGLHSLGLGSCALNWSVAKYGDKRLRRIANIPDHEVIIMLISVGHLPDSFRVAQSPRRPISDVLVRHSEVS